MSNKDEEKAVCRRSGNLAKQACLHVTPFARSMRSRSHLSGNVKEFLFFGLLFVDAAVVVAAWVPQLKPVCRLVLCTFYYIFFIKMPRKLNAVERAKL